MNTTMIDTTYDPALLHGSWQEGQLNARKQLELAPPSRGGRRSLEFLENGEMTWNGALNCGFGSRKLGTWQLGKELLSLQFTREQGYMNRQLDQTIDDKITYRVERLNAVELILLDEEGAKLYFVK